MPAANMGILGWDLRFSSAAMAADMAKARKSATSFRAGVNRSLGRVERKFFDVRRSVDRMGRSLFGLKGLAVSVFAGWGLSRIASEMVTIGSSMQDLRTSLDTINRLNSEGALSFEQLNEWALRMPLDTQEAITAYKNMRAMGIQPTLDMMTTLVDTASALGGGSDIMLGIARALGQIQTKGKVATEELYQLAERGVPAMEILRQKLGLTGEEVGNIGKLGLESGKVIEALIEGMAERFGGQSAAISEKFSGLVRTLKSYWVEFVRLIMESGVMDFLEEKLRGLRDWIDDMYRSGQLQAWAENVADNIVAMGQTIADTISGAVADFDNLSQAVESIARRVESAGKVIMPILQAIGFVAKAYMWTGEQAGNFMFMIDQMFRSPIDTRNWVTNANPEAIGRNLDRPAGGTTNNVLVQPNFMTGDPAAARRLADEIQRILDERNRRLGND